MKTEKIDRDILPVSKLIAYQLTREVYEKNIKSFQYKDDVLIEREYQEGESLKVTFSFRHPVDGRTLKISELYSEFMELPDGSTGVINKTITYI